jgi:hypothetical protein
VSAIQRQGESQPVEIEDSQRESLEKVAESDLPASDVAAALLEVVD